MSGHSKWHNIQNTKGAQDAKRAAAFTKIAKELIVAVKEGGGITDPANKSRIWHCDPFSIQKTALSGQFFLITG